VKDSTLEILAPLLNFLRGHEVLEETHESKFLLRGKDFVHFHDDPDGLWADAKLSKGRIRVSVATPAEQGELMDMIAEKLEAMESHGAGSTRKR
jgi:hypothetical protein